MQNGDIQVNLPLRITGVTMGDCELCGAINVSTRQISMSRARVEACIRCMEKSGHNTSEPEQVKTVVHTSKPVRRKSGGYGGTGRRGKDIMLKQEKELRSDFATTIRDARMNLDWDQKELAKRMAERVNIIQKTEGGKRPTDDVIRKFERILNIELMILRSNDDERKVSKSSTARSMTLADYFDQAKGNL